MSTLNYLFIFCETLSTIGESSQSKKFLGWQKNVKIITKVFFREDIKKTAERVEIVSFGGGSEKLLNFYHLQMMKNMEGGREFQSNILSLHRIQIWLI